MMTLHAAIEKILRQAGRPMTTHEIANELNKNNWYQKKDDSAITDFQIHGRTKNYSRLFNRSGTMVSLVSNEPIRLGKTPIKKDLPITKTPLQIQNHIKDEHYVLDLCDEILGLECARQHTFDFLLGDINSKGVAKRLPIDGYYKEINLAIEYRERQHIEAVNFFDKPNKITISGVHRGEQRKIYDQRRRDFLPNNGIDLIEISYADFGHNKQKRILRNPILDIEVIRRILHKYIPKNSNRS